MRAALLLALLLAVPASQAHRLPDVWMTGQQLLDRFDPNVKPKTLFSPDGTFVANLPANGWGTDQERMRHIRGIEAENGRAYIMAVYDATKGRSWCVNEKVWPDDETFFDDVIRDLRDVPHAQLQRRSAFDLVVEVWRKKWPCAVGQWRQP